MSAVVREIADASEFDELKPVASVSGNGQLFDKEVLFREDLERIYGPREADLEKEANESAAAIENNSEVGNKEGEEVQA